MARPPSPEPDAATRLRARQLYEGKPYATRESVAAEVGVTQMWVRRWIEAGGWSKIRTSSPAFQALVGEAANNMKVRMSEIGKPLDSEVAEQEASREAAVEFAVDVRAQVIDRHRKEWAAPRKIAYEAVQKSDFERAKLAKITAETLTLIQGGECRAYGITPEARADGQTVVVVDRSGATDVGEVGEAGEAGA